MLSKRLSRCGGFTLIEIVVTLVVLAIASTALLGLFSRLVSSSADPVIQQQATTIAEAYIEEILLKAFEDPQGGETGGAEVGEDRASYDDIQDYNSLATTEVRDQNNMPIVALSGYSVSVSVSASALDSVPAPDAMLIQVTVGHGAINSIKVSSYRTRRP